MGQERTEVGRPAGLGVPLGIGAGAAIGVLVGVLLEQLALGIAIGAGVGLVAGASLTATSHLPPARRRRVIASAVGILTMGVVVALGLLVLLP